MNKDHRELYVLNHPPKYPGTLMQDCDYNDLQKNYPHCKGAYTDNRERFLPKWKPVPMYHKYESYPAKYTLFSALYVPVKFAFYECLLEDEVFIKLLERYGEILPFDCNDSEQKIYGFHCMREIGYTQEFIIEEQSRPRKIDDRIYNKKFLPDSGLFTFGNDVQLYSMENSDLPIEENFVALCQQRGYTGFVFGRKKLA